MDNVNPSLIRKFNTEVLAGARRYAASDRSDPFALARALTHIRVGVASRGSDYSADQYLEERLIKAGERSIVAVVPAYKNVVRP